MGILLVVMVVFVVVPIWGIIDAALRPDDVWQIAQQSKIVWILLQIFLGILGAAIYFAAIRPKLMLGAGVESPSPPAF